MSEDIILRATKAFAAYSDGLGRKLIDEMIAEIEHLRTSDRCAGRDIIALNAKLSTTEHSLASFKSRAERAEFENERMRAALKLITQFGDPLAQFSAEQALHQPTETGTPK